MTQLIKEITPDLIAEIKAGALVGMPTETVYGLAANAFDEEAIAQIFKAKGRPQDNPLIVHLFDLEQLDLIARDVPSAFYLLYQTFSPGPLTYVLKKNPELSPLVTAGLDTVALRFPSHKLARKLLQASNLALVAPSANLSGTVSPSLASHVQADFEGKIKYVIDGGPAQIGLESTVLDLSTQPYTILRPGAISKEELEKCLGQDVHFHGREIKEAKSPGMIHRHYAPKTKVFALSPKDFLSQVKSLLQKQKSRQNKLKIALFIPDSIQAELKNNQEFRQFCLEHKVEIIQESFQDSKEASYKLYASLRYFDSLNLDYIFASQVKAEGIGLAYLNRLAKAAEN